MCIRDRYISFIQGFYGFSGLILKRIEACSLECLQAGAVQDYPLLITNSLNLMWIAAYEKEDGQLTYIHVIVARLCPSNVLHQNKWY